MYFFFFFFLTLLYFLVLFCFEIDPILFFDEVTLFDDELDDNGSARLSIKVSIYSLPPFIFYFTNPSFLI